MPEPETNNRIHVAPKQFEDPVIPAGKYEAIISRCGRFDNPADAKFNPGHVMVRVEYRVKDPDPDIDGKKVAPFAMSTEPGDNWQWRSWLEAMEISTHDFEGDVDLDDFIERDVVIEVSQRRGKPDRDGNVRTFMRVDSLQQA